MSTFSPYTFIIGASLVIIFSYFFSVVAKRTNVPSVLMLITLGVILQYGLKFVGLPDINQYIAPVLEILGIVGLIMIVLEASLDLELTKDRLPLITKSFLLAILSLGAKIYALSLAFQWILDINFVTAALHAIPLTIMSSAIVIPSIEGLPEHKKEFMIYESAFSDILGIMIFYFLIDSLNQDSALAITWNISSTIFITLAISLIVGYALIYIFQKIKSETKLFLLIAVLVIMYSIGKLFHLSSLIMILFFGLILKNPNIFFRGRLQQLLHTEELNQIYSNFKTVTLESSFVIRTFFFVIFGFSISLASLVSFKVVLISLLILVVVFGFRFAFIRVISPSNLFPELFIAPRGLISILLFNGIPTEFTVTEFSDGILLLTIISTSVIMAFSLIKYSKQQEKLKSESEPNTTGEEVTYSDIIPVVQDIDVVSTSEGDDEQYPIKE